MGACLITNNPKDYQQQTQFSPISMKNEIQANLAEKTLAQGSSKRSKPLQICEQNQKSAAPAATQIKSQDGSGVINAQQSSSSLQVSESVCDARPHMVSLAKPISLKEYTNASSLIERTELSRLTSESEDEADGENSENPSKASVEEIRMETPSNREIIMDMRGLGATEVDNRLIELTFTVRQPLRLNSVTFINGSVYSGEWLGGKRHGKGSLVWADGSRYDGDWRDNCSWGFGRLAYSDRQTYEGDFVRNCREGKGRMSGGGVIYVGQWSNDRRDGKGVQSWGNGERYEGDWLAGYKNGYGELYFEDGSYYKGYFNGNQIHGQGRYCWKGSRAYEGTWQHNRMSGMGVLTWINGQRHQGMFRNDRLNGSGAIAHPDGSTSRGNFESGRKHGLIIETDREGKVKEVEYYMGKRLRQIDHPGSTQSNSSKTTKSASQTFSTRLKQV